MNPLARVDPPSLARVTEVMPGDTEVPYHDGLTISARVKGFVPGRAYLHFRRFGEEWSTEEMLPQEDGLFSFSFNRVTEPFDYYIEARDHQSRHFKVSVYIEPAVESLSVVLHYPQYTNMPPLRIDRQVETCAGL